MAARQMSCVSRQTSESSKTSEMGRPENSFSPRDSVGTPPRVTDAIRTILGPIGLDPCSHPGSQVPAKVRYYLPEYAPQGAPRVFPMPAYDTTPAHVAVVGDGLVLPWRGFGLVYVNPPYSRLSEDPWILRGAGDQHEFDALHARPGKGERKRKHATAGAPDEIVWLLPVRTAGSWWQIDLVGIADMITCLNFRVQHTGEPDPSPFHQALAYRGPRATLWKEQAENLLGWTVRPQEIPF